MKRLTVMIAALLLILASSTLPAKGTESSHKRDVMIWIPPYSIEDSIDRLNESYHGTAITDGISHIGLQFWTPTSNGGIDLVSEYKRITDSDILKIRNWAHSHNIRVLLCVYNGTSGWDWTLASAAFDTHCETFTHALLSETLRLGLDGVDIDLEGNGDLEHSKAPFLKFIKKLSHKLHANGKELTVDTFAYKWHAPNRNWWTDLLPHIDALNVMGYAATGSQSKDWRSYTSIKEAAGQHANKLRIGMPGFESEWENTTHLEHLNWILNDKNLGLAIWDARLKSPNWRTKETWEIISKIKADKLKNTNFSRNRNKRHYPKQ